MIPRKLTIPKNLGPTTLPRYGSATMGKMYCKNCRMLFDSALVNRVPLFTMVKVGFAKGFPAKRTTFES